MNDDGFRRRTVVDLAKKQPTRPLPDSMRVVLKWLRRRKESFDYYDFLNAFPTLSRNTKIRCWNELRDAGVVEYEITLPSRATKNVPAGWGSPRDTWRVDHAALLSLEWDYGFTRPVRMLVRNLATHGQSHPMFGNGPAKVLYWQECFGRGVLPLKSTLPDLEAYNRIREHFGEAPKPRGDVRVDEHVERQREKIVNEMDRLAYRLTYLLYVLKGTKPHVLIIGSGVLGVVDRDFMTSIGREPKPAVPSTPARR